MPNANAKVGVYRLSLRACLQGGRREEDLRRIAETENRMSLAERGTLE